MADREKVVNALEDYEPYAREFDSLSVYGWVVLDALALLKEQEPIAPSLCGSKEPDWHGSWRYLCGKCKKPIDNKDRFCKRCGQAVKWE